MLVAARRPALAPLVSLLSFPRVARFDRKAAAREPAVGKIALLCVRRVSLAVAHLFASTFHTPASCNVRLAGSHLVVSDALRITLRNPLAREETAEVLELPANEVLA